MCSSLKYPRRNKLLERTPLRLVILGTSGTCPCLELLPQLEFASGCSRGCFCFFFFCRSKGWHFACMCSFQLVGLPLSQLEAFPAFPPCLVPLLAGLSASVAFPFSTRCEFRASDGGEAVEVSSSRCFSSFAFLFYEACVLCVCVCIYNSALLLFSRQPFCIGHFAYYEVSHTHTHTQTHTRVEREFATFYFLVENFPTFPNIFSQSLLFLFRSFFCE